MNAIPSLEVEHNLGMVILFSTVKVALYKVDNPSVKHLSLVKIDFLKIEVLFKHNLSGNNLYLFVCNKA